MKLNLKMLAVSAALLGLPLPTVLSKYSRALKKLQLAWKEAD
jgi:DNA-directed RNA polymerase specialized sigma24 family protein